MTILLQRNRIEDYWKATDGDFWDSAFTRAQTALVSGGEIHLTRNGSYQFASQITVTKRISILGQNPSLQITAGDPPPGGQRLVFTNTKGIVIGVGLGWVRLQGLNIYNAGNPTLAAANDGVYTESQLIAEACSVYGFPRHGWYLFSGSSAPGSNTSLSLLTACRAVHCGQWGIFIEGTDSSAGMFESCSASDNNLRNIAGGPGTYPNGGGIWDSGFLGNLVAGCRAENNNGGLNFAMDGAAAAGMLIGCTESPANMTYIVPPSQVFGGNVLPAVGASNVGIRGITSPETALLLTSALAQTGGSNGPILRIAPGGSNQFFRCSTTDDTTGYDFEATKSGSIVRYAWRYKGSSSQECLRFTTDSETGGRGGGMAVFTRGPIIGSLRVNAGATPPASDATYAIGDVFWNNTMTSGLPQYWRCTNKVGAALTWTASTEVIP